MTTNRNLLRFILWLSPIFVSFSHADELALGISENISDVAETTSSKNLNDLFNSPVAVSVVTAEQIRQAGITSIPEALKLIPGATVYEQTNGQYAVYLRGIQSVPNNHRLTSLANRFTLVMLDNRPVYNHFNGGTDWETLPIHVNDIERIEVVRGANSALYGPNAVTGVIHILSKRAKDKTKISAHITAGNRDTQIAQASVEQQWHDTQIRISALREERDRYQDTYYDATLENYVTLEQSTESETLVDYYPDRELSKENRAVFLSINNDPYALLRYDVSLSQENSSVQKPNLGVNTIYNHYDSQTQAANIKLYYLDWDLRVSHHWGESSVENFADFDYDQAVTQANLEYQFRLPQWIIRPGISFEDAEYDGDYLGGENHIRTNSYSLRTEYRPSLDSQLVAALRYDDYNIADKNYLSYQLLATHHLSDSTLIRGGISTANQSAFMIDSYVDLRFEPFGTMNVRFDYKGMEDNALTTIRTAELGLRHQFEFNNWIDIEIFNNQMKHFSDYITQEPRMDGDTLVTTVNLQELPTKAEQTGITGDWHYEQIDWDLNLFLTYQDTDIQDQYEDTFANTDYYNTGNGAAPTWFGGFVLNWQINRQWKFNLHGNYIDGFTSPIAIDDGVDFEIPSNFTLNTTATHQYNQWISGFVSVKNLFAKSSAQYFGTDEIKPMILFGLDISFDPN